METLHSHTPGLTTAQQIDMGIRQAELESREIDDRTARMIASMFHDGGMLTYGFVSTGVIQDSTETYRAFAGDYRTHGSRERRWLDWLGTYLLHAAPRGPVEGWGNLSW